ncbi:hypothetical protein [Accumulibacter sp.]|uniref:hypothetical protein n=1 Tax=Accumulibacter sp. TaxID=2053492 RepID=UPI00263815A5|nr:hypothetical protein [Accumulibacter sp.]
MSYVAERGWEIEAKRRREMYLERIRNVTAAYAARNRERLVALSAQGLDIFILEEYRSCLSLLERVERALSRDPEQARDENIRLSALMRSLGTRARENRRATQAAEKEAAEAAMEAERDAARERLAADRDALADRIAQEQAARDGLLDMIRKANQSLPRPIARDLCQLDLKALRHEIELHPVKLEDIQQIQIDLKSRLESVTERARIKAETLQFAEQREDARREMSAVLEDALALYTQLSDDLAQAAIRNLQSSLVDERVTIQTLDESLASIREAADDRALQEGARRHVVSGLLRELRNAGFIVSEPKLESGEAAAVVIKAQRPSGAQAAFRVNLDGMTYKFDHYQGQACLDEANTIMPRLQDIYGIELEEERISWRNPDMIGKSEKRLPESMGERRK